MNNFYHYEINEQSLSHAVEIHLPPIMIECEPKLTSKEIATKLVTLFFKEIEKDFRKQYPNHKRPIGFDHWWQDMNGTCVFGETKDVDLFIYLCDKRRYPTKIETIKITPNPPKRLPPQNTVVIKYVRNEIEIEEIRDELKSRYQSTFTVEDMMGTMRSKSRHIRVDFSDKKDYQSILTSGVVSYQGQIFDVDEYLPAPKVLLCSKCNEPGHMKKQCQLKFEKCRRCGGDRQNGEEHKECPVKCHHCGSSEHCANDYRCPSIIHFRRLIISEIRRKPTRLPPQVQLFIPVDCRPIGNSNRILKNPNITSQETNRSTAWNNSLKDEWPNLPTTSDINKQQNLEQTIKSFSIELQEIKQKYLENQQKIEQRFQEQLKNIQNGWLAIQNQISTQNEMISTTSTLMSDILFDSCQTFTNVMSTLLEDIKNKTRSEEGKKKLQILDEHLKTMSMKFEERKQSYHQFHEQLDKLMYQQRTAAISMINSLFISNNV